MYKPANPREIVYVDFETEAILPRPDYPPKPVGVAILEPGREEEYLAWGHPTGNNCTFESASRRLRALWEGAGSGGGPVRWVLGTYNFKFDAEVARTHLGLALPPPEGTDDALILGVLKDPRKPNHKLKTLVKDWLNVEAPERDEAKDWILANCKEQIGRKKSSWPAYISKAPGDLIGRSRACPDVLETRKMREYLHETALAMPDAYYRELRLIPVILDMERRGVPIDVERLAADVTTCSRVLENLDAQHRKYMGLPSDASLGG